jgi:hypothetical protein
MPQQKELTDEQVQGLVASFREDNAPAIRQLRRLLEKMRDAEDDGEHKELLKMMCHMADFIESGYTLKRWKPLRLALASFKRHFPQF